MEVAKFLFNLPTDESSPPKSPWGINIMKKTKKAGPKAFGARLEECQPGTNNKVSHTDLCHHLNAVKLFSFSLFSVITRFRVFFCSSFQWLWRSAVASWRRWVWNTPAFTESQGITPWFRCSRSSSTRAWTSTLQRRCRNINIHSVV